MTLLVLAFWLLKCLLCFLNIHRESILNPLLVAFGESLVFFIFTFLEQPISSWQFLWVLFICWTKAWALIFACRPLKALLRCGRIFVLLPRRMQSWILRMSRGSDIGWRGKRIWNDFWRIRLCQYTVRINGFIVSFVFSGWPILCFGNLAR